jgi:3-oxoacyl-(acyl-carrier-protein) synthase
MTVLTSEWNEEPQRASRPLDRSGIVLGEGPWIYVLEERTMRGNGAKIYAGSPAMVLPTTRTTGCG